jgi:23S rRNA pseudouridine1911/1915/1917 synthase
MKYINNFRGECDMRVWLCQIAKNTYFSYLKKNGKTNLSEVVSSKTAGAKKAELQYHILKEKEQMALAEIELFTGRHHQIRCQLAKIGSPIKGDLKYGAERSNPDGGISLHARHIEFVHPVSKELVSVTAPVPSDNLWQAFEKMVEGK